MPNSYDDLTRLCQQFEQLEKTSTTHRLTCDEKIKPPTTDKRTFSSPTNEKRTFSPTPTRRRSILKNKAKSADAATLLRLKSELAVDINIDNDEDEDEICNAKNVVFADDQNLVEIRKFVPSNDNMDLWATCDYYKEVRKPKTSFSLKNTARPPELAICFKDPYLETDYMEKFRTRNVALDRCGARERVITGVVMVRNIEYHKTVFVRFTLDKWKTNHRAEAVYIPNSSDGDTDKFTFSLVQPKYCEELEFAVCFKLSTSEHWDNNEGKNYKVQDILYASKD